MLAQLKCTVFRSAVWSCVCGHRDDDDDDDDDDDATTAVFKLPPMTTINEVPRSALQIVFGNRAQIAWQPCAHQLLDSKSIHQALTAGGQNY